MGGSQLRGPRADAYSGPMAKQPPRMVTVEEIFAHAQQVQDELKSQNDRGVAVIGALAVEDEVDKILRAVMIDRELPETGTQFKNKTDWAYQLGLISREEHDEIVRVLQIRNKMAHEIGMHSFGQPSVKGKSVHQLCSELTFCEKFYVGEGINEYFEQWLAQNGGDVDAESLILPKEYVIFPHGDDPRERFTASVKALISVLTVRKSKAQREPVPSPMSFEHLGDMFLGLNQGLRNAIELVPRDRQDQWRQAFHQPLLAQHFTINLINYSRMHHERFT